MFPLVSMLVYVILVTVQQSRNTHVWVDLRLLTE